MSDKIIDYLYNNYRNIYYTYSEEIEDEINNLIDNDSCSIYYKPLNYYSINSVPNILFIKIIPNLFRKCYVNSTLNIPNICPSIVQNSVTNFYLPKIIDEKYIKSFLYYNFPSNTNNYYTLEKLIKNTIYSNNLLSSKKKNETYSSFTTANILFSQIYSNDSMLIQLLNLNKFVDSSYYLTNNSLIGNNFKIEWDCTLSCYCDNNDDSIYIVGNYNDSLLINYNDASTLYNLFNNAINQNILKLINFNIINSDLNILYIIKYAIEVYNDILLQIQYYLDSKTYCLKDYMYPSNIPILFSLYNNFYKNQIETNNKELISTNINSVIPVSITIESYVNSFISVYFDTYPNNYLLKTVYISNSYALVFIGTTNNASTIVISDYIYYFISVDNPSPIKISNNWSSTTYYSTVISFVNEFLIYYESYLGGATAIEQNIYSNGGLYPNLGTNSSESQNIGYLYFFYKSNVLVGVAYLTLETDSSITPLGYGLALDYSDYNVVL
jgi:hypothetical protein